MRKLYAVLAVLVSLFQNAAAQTITPASPVSFCGSGILTVTGYSGTPTFQWQKNTVDIPGANTASYTVTSSGNYTVVLGGGPPVTVGPTAVTINPLPVVNFTFNNNNSCSGTSIQFNSTVTSGTGPFIYNWDFGDGNTSNAPNPIHAFTALGCGTSAFNVTLTITDTKGCTGSIIHPISVKQVPDVQLADVDVFFPFSNCHNSPTTANPNYTLQVNNISPDALTCIGTYTINWGDGSPSLTGLTNASFPLSHTYTTVGAFPLTVTATSTTNPGCTGTKTYIVANQTNPAGGLGTLGATTNLCAPATVPFIINNWQNNSIGTTYILDFGDGNSVTLTHPLNGTNTDQTVNHTYTTSSCPASTYTATLTVVNACDSTPYTAGNIQIRIKPQANFTTLSTACAGQSVCMTNSTILGGYGPNCSTATTYSWNFGDPASGANNTSSNSNPCHIYATAGTYTITLTASNPCGNSVVTKQICIAAIPTVSFTANNTTGCVPMTVTINNTSDVSNSCNNVNYNWTVSYATGFCGTSSGWAFTGGTNASSVNPSFSFTNPGNYTVTLSVTNPCGTFTSSQIITVKDKPVVTLGGINNTCVPATINPAASATNCGTTALSYLWTFTGGSPATANTSNPGPITYSTAGTYNVAVDVTNECGTTNATQPLNVQTVTTSNAGPAQTLCGSIVTMAGNTPVTGTGTWTQSGGPNTATITNIHSPNTTITGLIAGTYTFTWTINNNGCTSSSNVTVTISTGPSAANAGTNINLCLATSANLSGNTPTVGTGLWTQISGPNTAAIANPSSANTFVSGLVTGTYVFQWSISYLNCTPNTDQVTVTVNDNPTVAAAGSNQLICSSATIMAGNIAIVGNGLWTQVSGPNTALIVSPSSPTTTINGLIVGTYTFKWTISNGACSSNATVDVTVSPGPSTANAGTDLALCLATTANLSGNTPVIGNGMWTLVSGPNTPVISNPNSPNTAVTGLVTGSYVFKWTISFSNCTPNSDNVQVIVYDNPTTAAAGTDQAVCTSVVTMAGNSPVTGTGQWTQVSGPAATITNPSSPSTTITGLTPGVYVFKWKISNGTCPASEDDVQIIVSNIPTTPNAGPDQSLCSVNSATLNANTALSGTGQWTQVSGPNTATITNDALPNTTVTGLIPGVYIFSWTIGNGICPSSTDNVQVAVFADATIADAGPAQVKCGTSVTMAANTATVGTGLWTQLSGPNTAGIVNTTSPNTAVIGLITGVYVFQWTITNGACSSSSQVNITISSGPTAANAGLDQDLCVATSANLFGNSPAVGTGQWTQVSGPNTATIVNPGSANTSVTGLITGTYLFRWTISFSNCTPAFDEVQIRIFDNPTIANAGPDQNICIPSTVLSANTAGIGTGVWTQTAGPGTAVITNPSSPTSTITSLSGGIYSFTWTISNGPCPPSQDVVTITYSVIANNTINGATSVCINTAPPVITGSAVTGSVGPYAYQWQQSTNGGSTWNDITGATGIDYSPGPLLVTTCFKRIVTTALCNGLQANSSNTLCITVNPDAKALFTASSTLLCAPVNLDTIITVTPFSLQNQQYNWYHDGILIPGTINGFPPSYVISNPGQTVVIKLVTTSPYGCKSDSMNITFNTRPAVTANFVKDTTSGCGPLSVTFTNTSSILNNSIQYYWNFGDGSPILNGMQPPAPIVYQPAVTFIDTTYFVTLKAFSGCDTTIKRDSVKIFANPKARFTALAVGCSPFKDTIINNSFGQDPFTTYYWDFGDGTFDATFTNGALYHTYITGVVDTFTIQLIMQNRCSRDTQRMDVIVSPSNIVEHIVANASSLYGCAPHTVTFQNSSTGASVLFWDFGDGTPVEAIPNTQSTITHTYLTEGIFNIHITLENYCADTTVDKQVTVYGPPAAAGSVTPAMICTGDAVSTNNNSSNANSYEWFWGDGTSTAGFNATHIYSTGGIYFARLVARRINNFGTACTDTSAPMQVTVVDRIPAIIDVSPATNPCVPYAIMVSAANAASAAQVDWYFYDSHTAPGIFHIYGPTATYIYNTDGTDSVKLVVTNMAGCKDSTTKQIVIHKKPLAIFTPVNIKTCNTDTTATFAVSLNYSGTDPISYEWFINDVLAGNSNPFTYRFQAPAGISAVNNFSIKVLVKNSFGCGDTTLIGNFIIQTLGPRHIVVSPSLIQEQPHYTFSFTDTAQALPSSTYLWFTGDRNNQQLPGRDITYTYGDTGTYHVKLEVHDYETGCFAYDTVKVFIIPVPGYLYVPNAFCPGCHKAELRQFLPLGKGLKDYRLIIFNTWGQKVFETTSLDANGVPNQPWDGNWPADQNVKQGAFSWFIEAHYINGTEWKGMLNPKTGKLEKKGFLTIIR